MKFNHQYHPAELTEADFLAYDFAKLIGWDFDAHDCNVCKSDDHPTSEHKE